MFQMFSLSCGGKKPITDASVISSLAIGWKQKGAHFRRFSNGNNETKHLGRQAAICRRRFRLEPESVRQPIKTKPKTENIYFVYSA